MAVDTLTHTRSDTITEVVRESFVQNPTDGYFYPMEPGQPLARVYVAGGSYVIERRRNSRSAWAPVVVAVASEFDPSSFRSWRSRYPMVEI